MNWISIKEKLPPIGKKLLLTRPAGGLIIATLLYKWKFEEDTVFISGSDEKMLTIAGGYWLEIPEPPE